MNIASSTHIGFHEGVGFITKVFTREKRKEKFIYTDYRRCYPYISISDTNINSGIIIMVYTCTLDFLLSINVSNALDYTF